MEEKHLKETSTEDAGGAYKHLYAALGGLMIPLIFMTIPTTIIRDHTNLKGTTEMIVVIVVNLATISLLWSHVWKFFRTEKNPVQLGVTYGALWSTLALTGLVLHYLYIFDWI